MAASVPSESISLEARRLHLIDNLEFLNHQSSIIGFEKSESTEFTTACASSSAGSPSTIEFTLPTGHSNSGIEKRSDKARHSLPTPNPSPEKPKRQQRVIQTEQRSIPQQSSIDQASILCKEYQKFGTPGQNIAGIQAIRNGHDEWIPIDIQKVTENQKFKIDGVDYYVVFCYHDALIALPVQPDSKDPIYYINEDIEMKNLMFMKILMLTTFSSNSPIPSRVPHQLVRDLFPELDSSESSFIDLFNPDHLYPDSTNMTSSFDALNEKLPIGHCSECSVEHEKQVKSEKTNDKIIGRTGVPIPDEAHTNSKAPEPSQTFTVNENMAKSAENNAYMPLHNLGGSIHKVPVPVPGHPSYYCCFQTDKGPLMVPLEKVVLHQTSAWRLTEKGWALTPCVFLTPCINIYLYFQMMTRLSLLQKYVLNVFGF
ncbi:hypothetical protein ROZALSC1DRAFT_26927 [Rozella allomycis CSF55]|uniref:Uncharacterized protein n=1 Tax=Rozella allomycis (strain CSF55) TaxID=988480 RepID=A0A075AQA3_ROZAC|nr:hypothetical protein O9G_001295 [Rozella allomycis CSF55]RKP21672.1 hypothetical protein ROZALSC1DRAFT_26927 [Rozella allomycis CSF55]|eukprot:EPZ32393.1 hypothetical protein O9G_001295 [Rozella allomycis CSF55]